MESHTEKLQSSKCLSIQCSAGQGLTFRSEPILNTSRLHTYWLHKIQSDNGFCQILPLFHNVDCLGKIIMKQIKYFRYSTVSQSVQNTGTRSCQKSISKQLILQKQTIQNFSHDNSQKEKSHNRETIASTIVCMRLTFTKIVTALLVSAKVPCQCSWWPLVTNSNTGAMEIPQDNYTAHCIKEVVTYVNDFP